MEMSMSKSALGLLLGAGTALFLWSRRQRAGEDVAHAPAAAFAGSGAPEGSFVHTRDAGPEHMRDKSDAWDKIDQSSDESFPASDPPSSY